MSYRWQQIEQLYYATLEREESQRAAYLLEVCAGVDALRQEVKSSLAHGKRSEQFLETRPFQAAP